MNDKQQLMAMGEEMAERRTAACLGMCEGIPTGWREQYPFIWEGQPFSERLEHLQSEVIRIAGERNHAERQRDELLAALEALVKIIADTPRPDPDDVFSTIDEARNVINKVRGGV